MENDPSVGLSSQTCRSSAELPVALGWGLEAHAELIQGQMVLGFDVLHGDQGCFSFRRCGFRVLFVSSLLRVLKDIRNLMAHGTWAGGFRGSWLPASPSSFAILLSPQIRE